MCVCVCALAPIVKICTHIRTQTHIHILRLIAQVSSASPQFYHTSFLFLYQNLHRYPPVQCARRSFAASFSTQGHTKGLPPVCASLAQLTR